MPRRRKVRARSVALTIPLVVLPPLAILLFFIDYTVPFSLKTEWFEFTTKSGALVVIVLWVWYAIEIVHHPVQTGKYSYEPAVFDPPRFGQTQPPIECAQCGAEIPPFCQTCPNCGNKLRLY